MIADRQHEHLEAHLMEAKMLMHFFIHYPELADKMGITQAAYSQMEKSNTNIRRATLEKIAAAIGVRVEQLID